MAIHLRLASAVMPMEQATCPQCNARIGGQNHEAAAGVTHADDIELCLQNMQI
jgi:hypothetical protein